MTLQQLHYFRVLANTCHFTKAADQLFISQSSLSYAISELEKELNVRLFERRGNRTYLSKYGKKYVEEIGPALDLIDEANDHIREMSSSDKGDVRIGIIPSLLKSFSYIAVKGFYQNNPDSLIDIKIHHYTSGKNAIAALESGKIDLAICSSPKDNMASHVLFSQKLYLYVSANHPFAEREYVTLEDLAGQDYVALSKATSYRNQIDLLCQRKGIKRSIVHEQNSYTAAMSFVSSGLGVAILPYALENEAYGARAIRIDDPDFCRTIYLVSMKDKQLSAAVELFKLFLTENSTRIYDELSESISED